MSTNPNTVKSQDELNEGGRKSDVLVEAISKLEITTKKCERLQKQLDIAKNFIFRCAHDITSDWYVSRAEWILHKIEELDND